MDQPGHLLLDLCQFVLVICEFATHEELKNYAGIPFAAGMICVVYFYIKRLILDKGKKDLL